MKLKMEYFSGKSQVYANFRDYVNIKRGVSTVSVISLILEWTNENYQEANRRSLITCHTWEEFLEKASHKRFSKDLLGLVRLNYMIGEQRAKN